MSPRLVSEADRRVYAKAYAQPGGRLTMPMLVLSGEKAGGTFLIEQAKLAANDVRGQIVRGRDRLPAVQLDLP